MWRVKQPLLHLHLPTEHPGTLELHPAFLESRFSIEEGRGGVEPEGEKDSSSPVRVEWAENEKEVSNSTEGTEVSPWKGRGFQIGVWALSSLPP